MARILAIDLLEVKPLAELGVSFDDASAACIKAIKGARTALAG